MDETEVQIAVMTSQGFVLKWRVWFWVILHLIVLVIGLFFTIWHLTQYEQPWMENPAFGAFCLDTGMVCEILREMNLDPWLPNSTLPVLMLGLDDADSGVRRVVEMMENENQEFERDAISESRMRSKCLSYSCCYIYCLCQSHRHLVIKIRGDR